MKLKKWITWSLLFSFFVLVTPRTIWHNCNQESHTHHSKDEHSSQDLKIEKKCFACDFSIDFLTINTSSLYHYKPKPSVLSCSLFESFKQSISFQSFSHRGPPVFLN